MDKHFIRVDIDIVKNPGGKELYENYGPQRGVPTWTILDAKEKVLADSMREKDNVGFPYQPHEVAHFFDALRKSCADLGKEELRVLQERLDEHCKARKAQLEEAKKKDAEQR
jgi:hypothetical protein